MCVCMCVTSLHATNFAFIQLDGYIDKLYAKIRRFFNSQISPKLLLPKVRMLFAHLRHALLVHANVLYLVYT